MVLEQLVDLAMLEKRTWELGFFGFFWTVFSGALSLYLFPEYASLLTVTFIVILTLPFVYKVISEEEHHYDEGWGEKSLLRAHAHTFSCFLWLFLGILLGYLAWFTLAPQGVVDTLFQAQTSTISSINGPTGSIISQDMFWRIFWHNSRIMLVSILLAFFLGAGPIFILAWNASVIAAALGNLLNNEVQMIVASGGDLGWGESLHGLLFPFYRYLIHGVPEILAYIVAGLAGGIISVVVIRHHVNKPHLYRFMADAGALITLSVLLLLVAAFIEVKVLAQL